MNTFLRLFSNSLLLYSLVRNSLLCRLLLGRILNASLRTDSCAFYCGIGWSYCINWSYFRITHHFARSKNITY